LSPASRQTYGTPRIHRDLRDGGVRVGRKRVARLLKQAGLRGVCRRRRYAPTTVRAVDARPAPDLVQRAFHATAPNTLWVADITYLPTQTRTLYLAVVLDVWSRRIVGWAMETHLRTSLVLAALDTSVRQDRRVVVLRARGGAAVALGADHDLVDAHAVLARLDADRLHAGRAEDHRARLAVPPVRGVPAPARHAARLAPLAVDQHAPRAADAERRLPLPFTVPEYCTQTESFTFVLPWAESRSHTR
jgi:hypothetical protein